VQRQNVAHAASQSRRSRARTMFIVTHGNGPQVGLLALQAAAYSQVSPYPLDVLGAESGRHDRLHDRAGAQELLPQHQIVTLPHPDRSEHERSCVQASHQTESALVRPCAGGTPCKRTPLGDDGQWIRVAARVASPSRSAFWNSIPSACSSPPARWVVFAGGGGIPVTVTAAAAPCVRGGGDPTRISRRRCSRINSVPMYCCCSPMWMR